MTSLGSVENDRSNNFDFLRFVMASLVLFYHCYGLLGGGSSPADARMEQIAGLGAGAAVDFFFVISGFLVTQSWLRTPQAGAFLLKRILRIYPAFILASVFCALVAGPIGAANAADYFRHLHPVGFAAYMLLLVGPYLPPAFLHVPFAGQVDGSFYTLRYEFECYLFVLLLGLTGLLRRPAFVLTGFLALAAVALAAAAGHALPIPEPGLSPCRQSDRLGPFCALLSLRHGLSAVPGEGRLLAAPAAGCAGRPSSRQRLRGLVESRGGDLRAYLLFWIAFRPAPALSHWAKYGDFSYGMYLFAFPIQQSLICRFQPHLTPLRLFCLAFPLTLLLSALSWYLVEKPALRLKKGAARVKRE